ncbi:MAG: UDP-N-acetylmuramate dehydrogenase [Peptococcaceae bacterium]|nr:UDP-N-acetylmuramate dehydrogenase [Peptococcaceae bacterium]
MTSFVEGLKQNIQGNVLPDENLARHTTWRIGGPAEVLVMPVSRQDVLNAIAVANSYHKEITVIGNGSNLLVADAGIPGMVLKLAGCLNSYEIRGLRLTAESGCRLPGLVQHSVEAGLAGLEFAAGIPAALGGALWMNAGAHGCELGDLVEEVIVCNPNGKIRHYAQAECGFAYRTTRFQSEPGVILAASFKLTRGERAKSEAIVRANMTRRRQNQPLEYPNAGSVFRNPPGSAAGKLIELSGGKGLRVGGAMIAEKHANFIINLGDASAQDVLDLIAQVQDLVWAKFQVELHPEIKLVGFSRE